MNNLRDKIHKLPKADVHNHLHLGGSFRSLQKRYPQSQIELPTSYNGLKGMIDYIYNDLGKLLRTKEDVVFFMENAIESSIADNVSLLEASVDINLVQYFDHSIEELISTITEIKERYKNKIDFRPEIGINKDAEIKKAYSDGIRCMDSGVFYGIDIYGKEHNQSLDSFTELYEEARSKNIKTKVHIGEFSNCETIENAIALLKPNEIQHGIRAVESQRTMDLLLENEIRLNICPQSNISLGSVKSIAEHPIRELYDQGIKLTVNTDDLILFDATITDQLTGLIENKVFNFEEIDEIRKNGFS